MHDALLVIVLGAHTRCERAAPAGSMGCGRRESGAVTQESVGGARESGRLTPDENDAVRGARGVHRTPGPSRILRTTEAVRASGALRKRWNAQSAGCMHADVGGV